MQLTLSQTYMLREFNPIAIQETRVPIEIW